MDERGLLAIYDGLTDGSTITRSGLDALVRGRMISAPDGWRRVRQALGNDNAEVHVRIDAHGVLSLDREHHPEASGPPEPADDNAAFLLPNGPAPFNPEVDPYVLP
jgi:hypothetical protein